MHRRRTPRWPQRCTGGEAGRRAGRRDVRAAVDLCHRDGSLKRSVAADPGRYIHEARGPCAASTRLPTLTPKAVRFVLRHA